MESSLITISRALYRWTALNHLRHREEEQAITLSTTACDFMILLQDSLLLGSNRLHRHLFSIFWQQVVKELDILLFNMVNEFLHFYSLSSVRFWFLVECPCNCSQLLIAMQVWQRPGTSGIFYFWFFYRWVPSNVTFMARRTHISGCWLQALIKTRWILKYFLCQRKTQRLSCTWWILSFK